ncbi:MAG: dual specificity protein phosphatase family protein [Nitrospiraceae bacterium]|nr:dual specificity protein phosphatase family protein [Nitrospiraceae bacterium]
MKRFVPGSKIARSLLLLIMAAALLSGGYYLVIFGDGNFHAVTPGEAYRCAQPDYSRLEYYAKTYGIKSIINLRGRNASDKWYKDEIRFSVANGINHYDIALSASHEPTPEQLNQILQVFRTAPRPVLIHCKSGSDRSGLVAAMWKVAVDGEPKYEADNQLSIRYGHIPVGSTTAMDRYFFNWQPVTIH